MKAELQELHPLLSGRLRQPPAASLVETAFAQEVGDGPALYKGMSLADLAYTVMLIECNLIPAEPAASLLGALLDLHHISGDQFSFDPAHGDVYSNRERAVRERSPEGSEWFGFGRARREATTVGYVWETGERLLSFVQSATELCSTLLDLAFDHQETLMPDYTYLQRAQPTTLGHYLLTFVQALLRDIERARNLYERLDALPAGMGSVNGSRLPLDRERLRELLGFQELVQHARDAMWRSDLAVEAMSVVQIALLNVDRLTEDLQIWATQEYGFVELADSHSRISVIMPHKKNPYALSYIRGLCRQAVGQTVSVAVSNLTPTGQVDNRMLAYGIVPDALERGQKMMRLLNDVLCGMTFDPARMQAMLDPMLAATDLAELLVLEEGIGPRTAHRLVGVAVRRAVEQGGTLTYEGIDAAMREVAERPLQMSREAFEQSMQPKQIVAARSGIGGAAAGPMQEMIYEGTSKCEEAESWWIGCKSFRVEAERYLLERARELAGFAMVAEEV